MCSISICQFATRKFHIPMIPLAFSFLLAGCGGGGGGGADISPTSVGSVPSTNAAAPTSNTQTAAVSLPATTPAFNQVAANSMGQAPVPVPPRLPPAPAPTIGNLGLLGAGLRGIADWDRSHAFVDLMRQARKFGTVQTAYDGLAVLGADGWPVGDFGVTLMTDQAGVAGVAGVYNFSFTGHADVSTAATSATIQAVTYAAASNTTAGQILVPEGEGQLFLSFRNTGAGIKNLKVIRPGYPLDSAPTFTREYLTALAPFKTLRLMDWLNTNNSPVKNWSDRATRAGTHYFAPNGIPWEDIIELANLTGKDIWINIPAQANDDYVRNLANLLFSTLSAGSKVYIEYSNELWNSGFSQFSYNATQARAEIAANPGSPLNYDGQGDNNGVRRTAERLKQIGDIFRAVVGTANMLTTYRPVLSGQFSNPWVQEQGLSMIEAVYGPPKNYFYGIAGAPYFTLGALQNTDGLNTQQVLDALAASINDPNVPILLEHHADNAIWYGLKYLAYEGGDDTFGAASIPAKQAAQMDPQMEMLCINYLNNWYSAGLGEFNWFVVGASRWDTPYGTYTLQSDLAISTPKTACVEAINAEVPPTLRSRHTVPGSWDAREYVGAASPYPDRVVQYVRNGGYIDYVVNAPSAGTYQLLLKGGANATTDNALRVNINGRTVVDSFALPYSAVSAQSDQAQIPISLSAGFSVIRISSASQGATWYLSMVSIR